MKVFAVVLIISAIWFILASVREGRGRFRTCFDLDSAWVIEQHDPVVRLGQHAVLPASHPLARLSAEPPPRA